MNQNVPKFQVRLLYISALYLIYARRQVSISMNSMNYVEIYKVL